MRYRPWWTIAGVCFSLFVAAHAGADMTIKQINPVPGQNETTPVNPARFAMDFDGEGTIDSLASNAIVISDHGMRLAGSVKYFMVDGSPASQSDFAVGDRVDFELDADGNIEILWHRTGE